MSLLKATVTNYLTSGPHVLARRSRQAALREKPDRDRPNRPLRFHDAATGVSHDEFRSKDDVPDLGRSALDFLCQHLGGDPPHLPVLDAHRCERQDDFSIDGTSLCLWHILSMYAAYEMF